MSKIMIIAILTLHIAIPAIAAEGVFNIPSSFSAEVTADRMEKVLKSKGMTIFNRINHSEAADKVGIPLRDAELIIFGNPKVGSPLMQCQQTVAIDLPQKVLIWKDEQEQVWLSYNDPRYLKNRHDITGCEEILVKIEQALAGLTRAAATQ
ncbi:MAG TPA: DUF302 domain-containing protein [Geopsychrobacteraceae bacterium]|nr:DUF302 domain-containing protein [Geopsychrobacteraceae bacterium]